MKQGLSPTTQTTLRMDAHVNFLALAGTGGGEWVKRGMLDSQTAGSTSGAGIRH